MSHSANCSAAASEEPVVKKQKVGDEVSAASPSSHALLLSSCGVGSAGVKAHVEDAHVMFDEYVQPTPPPLPLPPHHSHLSQPLVGAPVELAAVATRLLQLLRRV